MKKIIIIGGGFAGLSCASGLSHHAERLGIEVTLIDRQEKSHFLPLLPDCIGRGLNPENLINDIDSLSSKFKFSFLKAQVSALDLEGKRVTADGINLGYDYLLIASGSETNFYGNTGIENNSFKLDDAYDAAKIRKAVEGAKFDTYIIAGGGYTGIEIATNLRRCLNLFNRSSTIKIIERAPSILGPLPQWMKDYVAGNLKLLNIEVFCNSSVRNIKPGEMLIWAAGVRCADYIQKLQAEKNPQGRIKADDFLRLNESCFVSGDSSLFAFKGTPIRMAVQFAIRQGKAAAKNIIRSIEGRPLKKFKPVDLGYIIPMANNRSCGKILGINLRGRLPTALHYFMCLYRLPGLKNKIGLIRDIIKGGRKP